MIPKCCPNKLDGGVVWILPGFRAVVPSYGTTTTGARQKATF
jgi:hypothetical protein